MVQPLRASPGECLAYADHRETAIYRDTAHAPFVSVTEIYCFDPSTGKSRLLFSDEKESAMLRTVSGAQGKPFGYIVTAKNRLFYVGVLRTGQRVDEYVHQLGSIFRIDYQNQDRLKKICDIQSVHPVARLDINPRGTKVGYIGYTEAGTREGSRPIYFVHNSTSGAILAEIDLQKVSGSCGVGGHGWVDDNHLVFETGPGDVHMSPPDCVRREGSYLVTDDGKSVERLSPHDVRARETGATSTSADKRYRAYATEKFDPASMITDEVLWLKNVETNRSTPIVSARHEMKLSTPKDLEHHFGIVGWMDTK